MSPTQLSASEGKGRKMKTSISIYVVLLAFVATVIALTLIGVEIIRHPEAISSLERFLTAVGILIASVVTTVTYVRTHTLQQSQTTTDQQVGRIQAQLKAP